MQIFAFRSECLKFVSSAVLLYVKLMFSIWNVSHLFCTYVSLYLPMSVSTGFAALRIVDGTSGFSLYSCPCHSMHVLSSAVL